MNITDLTCVIIISDTEIAQSNDTEMAKDNSVTVEVNLVKDDIVSLTVCNKIQNIV